LVLREASATAKIGHSLIANCASALELKHGEHLLFAIISMQRDGEAPFRVARENDLEELSDPQRSSAAGDGLKY
jgi:hypothetical protein